MEAYLSAAGKISRLAIGDVSAPTQAVFEVPADTAQNYHIEGLPFGTRGGILIKYQFPADGEYTFKVKGVTGYFQAVLGGVKGEQARSHGGWRARDLFDWDKEISNTTGNGKATRRSRQSRPAYGGRDIPRHERCAGQRTQRPFERTMNTPGSIPGYHVLSARWSGLDRRPVQCRRALNDTAARRKIFLCRPTAAKDEPACARTIIAALVKHAYRRPSTQSDVSSLMQFYQDGRADNGSFDDGIEAVDPARARRSRIRLSPGT